MEASRRDTQGEAAVDKLIEAMVAKLNANRGVLAKSLHHGRISWRSSNGKVDVKLEPEL